MRFWLTAVLLGGVAYCVSEGASAGGPTIRATATRAQMLVRGSAEAPVGYIEFCASSPAECLPHGGFAPEMRVVGQRWRELDAVNRGVNQSIKPMSDMDQYGVIERWTYPDSGFGDCEDYVLLKRRKLMELGWPESDLLITVVRDENGEGHAVLTVRSTGGDLILDNKHSKIRKWDDTPYTYIKRQSPADPRRWDALMPARQGPTIAAAGADAKK